MTAEQIMSIIATQSGDATVSIISTEEVSEATFVRFTWDGNHCVAIIYPDGSIFTPYDWCEDFSSATPEDIENIKWCDGNRREAIVLNGLPRQF